MPKAISLPGNWSVSIAIVPEVVPSPAPSGHQRCVGMIGVRTHPLPGVAADAVPRGGAEHLTAMTDEHRQGLDAIFVLPHGDPPQIRPHRRDGERATLAVKHTA
jgi:hypothetical protein